MHPKIAFWDEMHSQTEKLNHVESVRFFFSKLEIDFERINSSKDDIVYLTTSDSNVNENHDAKKKKKRAATDFD